VVGVYQKPFCRKSGLCPGLLLFVFLLYINNDIVINIDCYIETDRPTANLAIFNVILMWHRGVQKHFYCFSAIRATHGFFT
jgi:hypothetical protein